MPTAEYSSPRTQWSDCTPSMNIPIAKAKNPSTIGLPSGRTKIDTRGSGPGGCGAPGEYALTAGKLAAYGHGGLHARVEDVLDLVGAGRGEADRGRVGEGRGCIAVEEPAVQEAVAVIRAGVVGQGRR